MTINTYILSLEFSETTGWLCLESIGRLLITFSCSYFVSGGYIDFKDNALQDISTIDDGKI